MNPALIETVRSHVAHCFKNREEFDLIRIDDLIKPRDSNDNNQRRHNRQPSHR